MDHRATEIPQSDFQSFLNAPVVADIDEIESDVVIIGAPYGVPYGSSGIETACSSAPSVIRAASARYGFGSMIDHHDFDHGGDLLNGSSLSISDCGDVRADHDDVPGNVQRITSVVKACLDGGAIPIVLGGDDSIPIPVFRAYEDYGPLTIVQIDAHIDWRDEIDGVTEGYSSTMRRASEMPWVEGIVQIGMRGVGSARRQELDDALEWGARIVTADQIHHDGVEAALNLIPAGARCFITIDCDGLDPSVMPAVGAPSPGGLTFFQARTLLQQIVRQWPIAGVDLVELTPHRDINDITAITAVRLLTAITGQLARVEIS